MISFLVATVAQVLILAIIARALLSWFPGWRALTPVTVLLDEVTNPILRPLRRRLPAFGGLDPRCTTTSSTPPTRAATCTAASRAPTPSNGWRWTDVPA